MGERFRFIIQPTQRDGERCVQGARCPNDTYRSHHVVTTRRLARINPVEHTTHIYIAVRLDVLDRETDSSREEVKTGWKIYIYFCVGQKPAFLYCRHTLVYLYCRHTLVYLREKTQPTNENGTTHKQSRRTAINVHGHDSGVSPQPTCAADNFQPLSVCGSLSLSQFLVLHLSLCMCAFLSLSRYICRCACLCVRISLSLRLTLPLFSATASSNLVHGVGVLNGFLVPLKHRRGNHVLRGGVSRWGLISERHCVDGVGGVERLQRHLEGKTRKPPIVNHAKQNGRENSKKNMGLSSPFGPPGFQTA